MTPLRRALLGIALAGTALTAGALGAVTIALMSHGVFATAAPAWTARIALPVGEIELNVPGLLRLATSPAARALLDGRTLTTRFGPVHFTRDGDALVARCAPCRIEHPALAAEPLLRPEIVATAARRGAAVHGHVASGALRVNYAAQIAADTVRVRWALERVDAADALRVLASVVPEARWGRFDGAIEARGTLTLPQRTGSVQLNLDALAVDDLGTAALTYGEFTLACRAADGRVRRIALADGSPQWMTLAQAGPYLRAAVIAAEDQRFGEHAGIDEEELSALLAALRPDAQARGASTLTQQLARTLFTGGERTAARKLREALYALEMERTLGKARILELYLNTVDWGPGLCGARAAARAYFGKPPARLTPLEAAWLASILRQPHAAHARQFVARSPERARAEGIVMQMREFPRRDRERWVREPLMLRAPPAAPAAAPTLAAQLR
jgi:hypothetical protein